MDEKLYIVNKKSIVTRRGIKGHGEAITKFDIGQNFELLIEKGWIIEKPEIKEEKKEDQLPKENPVIIEPKKNDLKKDVKTPKKIELGAVKKEEFVKPIENKVDESKSKSESIE